MGEVMVGICEIRLDGRGLTKAGRRGLGILFQEQHDPQVELSLHRSGC